MLKSPPLVATLSDSMRMSPCSWGDIFTWPLRGDRIIGLRQLALRLCQPPHGVDIVCLYAVEVVFRLRVNHAEGRVGVCFSVNVCDAPIVTDDGDILGLMLPPRRFRVFGALRSDRGPRRRQNENENKFLHECLCAKGRMSEAAKFRRPRRAPAKKCQPSILLYCEHRHIPHCGGACKPNSRCVVFRAVFTDFSSITKEMLLSAEPWAMAMRFTFSRPSALKVRPAMPGVPRMFSPTTATMAILESTVMCSTL